MPPGFHPAAHEQIKERCVNYEGLGCGDRVRLFEGYEKLVAALQLVGLPAEQWIGGSFVSNEDGPQGIDLVNYCDVYVYESLPSALKAIINQYFQGNTTAKHCHCDSYFVPLPPKEHHLNADFMILRNYWEKELGHDHKGQRKGIILRHVEITESRPLEESANAATS